MTSLFTSAVVSCPSPVVENGVRIDGRPPYTYKSFVTYRCNAGYEMEGQASLTCEIEGWSAPYPTCKGKTNFSVCYLTHFSLIFLLRYFASFGVYDQNTNVSANCLF